MNDFKTPDRSIRYLTISAVAAAFALTSTASVGAGGQVIGQLAADGEVIIGEGANALNINNDVTPYFEGDLITTADGSEAMIRFARSSSHFSTLPLTDAVGRRAANGEFQVEAAGQGVRFSFPTDAEFSVRFDCMTIRNGAVTNSGNSAAGISGSVIAADGQVHVQSESGRLIVSTDTDTEYLIKQNEKISSCAATTVAAADNATQSAPIASTTGFEKGATSNNDVVVTKTSNPTPFRRTAGAGAAMLGTAAVSLSAGGNTIQSDSPKAAAEPTTSAKASNEAAAGNQSANGTRQPVAAKANATARPVKVSRNTRDVVAGTTDEAASFGGKHRHSRRGKPGRHHGGCFGDAASPVAGGKHNKCKHKGGKRRHW